MFAFAALASAQDGHDESEREAFEHLCERGGFSRFELHVAGRGTVAEYERAMRSAVSEGWHRASTTAGRFAEFRGDRRSRWTVAALVEEGKIFERLAQALVVMERSPREDPFVLHPDAMERSQFLHRWLSTERDRAECRALARYVMAVRQSREVHLATPEHQYALQRLVAVGFSRASECVLRERPGDGGLLPLERRELATP